MNENLNNIANDFSQQDGVVAVVLSGSSSSGYSDVLSDFDIYIYSEHGVAPQVREDIAKKYTSEYKINNSAFEEGDVWTLPDGVMLDFMFRSLSWTQDQVGDVWVNHNARVGYTTCFIYNIANSKILYDKGGVFKVLQEQTLGKYPDRLEGNIVTKNLPLLLPTEPFSFFEQIEKAIKRDDIISVNHRISAFLASYFDVLFAKNRVLHPGEKRLIRFAKENCALLPEHFERDINNLIRSNDKITALNSLVSNLVEIL